MNSTRRAHFPLISRRSFLQSAALATASLGGWPVWAKESAPESDPLLEYAKGTLSPLGKLKTKRSVDIAASRFSIGCECLDRRMWEFEKALPQLANLGAKWARVQTGWARCETVKGEYDFAWLDKVVDRLREIGIQPWFNLGYGNRLYTPAAPDASAVGFAPSFTEEARAGWTAFVEALASHFAGRVKQWEIWNEPNGGGFWRPKKPNAADYVELVKLTAPVIRRRIPDVTIVGGAVAGCDLKYVEGCITAGLAEAVDRISFHPYNDVPEAGYDAFVAAVRKLLGERNSAVKLWQGECGCPSKASKVSGWEMERKGWSEARQARWLLRRLMSDLAREMELVAYFHSVDLLRYNWGNGPTNFDQSMGLLRGDDFSPKPSYFAYQSLCSLIDLQTKRDPALVADGVSDKQFKSTGFVRNGHALYAYWSAVSLFETFTPQTVSLRLPVPAAATLPQPVLIDPLSQRVYRLEGKSEAGVLTLSGLPLQDYPLIVADRSEVQMAG